MLNQQTNEIIVEKVQGAYSFGKRLKGLMFTKSIPEDYGLHIDPCPSIHTFFMNFPIDVLYLNRQNEIVGIDEELKPGKVGRRIPKARSVIELPAGRVQASSIAVGQTVAIVDEK
ncbi:DUF192 domain-containing protein [Thalassorhabdus alkalitolerans]|uniref:DUF192 domain-containing protein n=1 Tax=Thalassorhabdus alkalitolerans TaxID=2282697 RepID=A0ABW0YLW2_9BACI